MQNYLIKNIQVVNEGSIKTADVLITNGRIEKIAPQITKTNTAVIEINGEDFEKRNMSLSWSSL